MCFSQKKVLNAELMCYSPQINVFWCLKPALEAMDICGHACGVRYSQINPHRTLKQVREYEASLTATSFADKNRILNKNPEKNIN